MTAEERQPFARSLEEKSREREKRESSHITLKSPDFYTVSNGEARQGVPDQVVRLLLGQGNKTALLST